MPPMDKISHIDKACGTTAIYILRSATISHCFSILVAICVLSIIITLQWFVIRNPTPTSFKDSTPFATRMHYDNSRQYVIQDSVFVGSDWSSLTIDGRTSDTSSFVCLATQASVEKMHHIIDSGNHWKGPMSVAVFTPGVDHHISVIYLQYLIRCFQDVMFNVSVHWVFPVGHHPKKMANLSSHSVESFDCSRRKEVLQRLLDKRPSSMMSWRQSLHYPQNLMRNVARKSCLLEHVILTDADIVPSIGMSQALSALVSTDSVKKCGCCVYVIPTYEVQENFTLPRNKKELLNMVAKKKARSYRRAVHVRNQAATNVSAWEALPNRGSDVVSVAYRLPIFRFGYEPFYMSKDSVPPHDERFVGYGHTRNTQVYEMQTAGYKFFVLDNVFFVHLGMARKRFNLSKRRQKEVSASYILSRDFLAELKVKYPVQIKGNLKNCLK